MAHSSGTALHTLVGPAITQALQLARYQASKNVSKNIVEVDENDVINQKPTLEEERLMISNAAVVSALEDLFSWIHKDKTHRTSQLSYVESWRFHRAMYRVWIVSTLFGYGSAPHGQRVTGASLETQEAFLNKFTSQELIQISKVSRFLRGLAGWVILAECKRVGSLDVYDFDGLYLFAGPHIILRCYEEQSSDPLPWVYIFDDGIYDHFLLPSAEGILSQRKATIPLGFVGTILDGVSGTGDTCRGCGREDASFLGISIPHTPDLYNEKNWARLKGYMGLPSEIFVKLASNVFERPLFETLREANYDTLFRQLFTHKGDQYKDWTEQDWVCLECAREFFRVTVFRWWHQRKAGAMMSGRAFSLQAGQPVPPDCKHGYYCKDQCFESGLDHAKRFNHACEPADLMASLAHFHSH